MVQGGETHQAGKWSAQAVQRLAKDGLLPTPRNYAIYYDYFSGRNPALCDAIDSAAARGNMTQEQCDDIYFKYILPNKEIAFLNDADSVLDKELKKVMDILLASAKGTGEFGEKLDDFSGKINRSGSIDMLRDAVAKITEETKIVSEQNSKLQQELADTTVQLCEIRTDFDRVHRESQNDPLTEVGNRKFFDEKIVETLKAADEEDDPLSVLMVDIDHFKDFNDIHGHLVGDQVLRLVARTLVENLKGRDVICRYGGEEFVIMLPRTRLSDAERVANQLRQTLANKHITRKGSNEDLGIVTISVGATQYQKREDSEVLIARADMAMYQAKQTGRNRVVCIALDEPIQ